MKKQQAMALLLASAMALGIASCGDGRQGPSGGTGSSQAGGSQTGGSQTEGGEVKPVTMAFMFYSGALPETQLVQDAVNEILEEKAGAQVSFMISDASSYKQNMTLSLSSGETIDILSTLNLQYPTLVQQGYLKDLEEDGLLQTYGKGILENIDQIYIDACRIGGGLYGLPNNRDMAQGRGCAVIVNQYLNEIDYDVPETDEEIVKITLDELNEIYTKLHEKFPDKEVYRPTTGSMSQFSNVDLLGGTVFGVLLNYGAEPKVENLFTSDFYKEYCARIYSYNQMGYIGQDAVTDTSTITELVTSGKIMSYTTGGKPGIKVQETGLCQTDVTVFQTLEDYISSASVASFPWAIPENTADPVTAMKVLNELYADPEVANLISWGIEGTHYKALGDGLIDYADGVDASTSGWKHSQQWAMPNQFITHIWTGNAPTLWTEIDAFNREAEKSVALGFSFDTQNVQTELTALQNVYDEYQKSVEYGMVDPETAIPEMNEKMMSAGLQKVIDEKQTQLDAWMQQKKS